MFFFFFPNTGAVQAFKDAVAAEGSTYDEVAKRMQVSPATLSKFIAGRPLSEELLKKLVSAFEPEHGKNVLLGHLHDEIKRAGLDPTQFRVFEQTRHTYLLEQAAKLIAEKPDRAIDLVKLIDIWQ